MKKEQDVVDELDILEKKVLKCDNAQLITNVVLLEICKDIKLLRLKQELS